MPNAKKNIENIGTRQRFSVGNPKIEILTIFASKIGNFKKCARQKKHNFLSKNSKNEKFQKQHQKHRDASTICSRKSRNCNFISFFMFFLPALKKKFAIALSLVETEGETEKSAIFGPQASPCDSERETVRTDAPHRL